MFSQGAFSEWTYWLAVVLPFASVHPQTCIFLVEVISQCRSLMGNPGVLKPRWATYWVQSGQEEFLAPFWERVISFIEPARIKVEAWKLPEWFTCHSLQSERWLGIWEVWDLWLIIMHITCSLTRFKKKFISFICSSETTAWVWVRSDMLFVFGIFDKKKWRTLRSHRAARGDATEEQKQGSYVLINVVKGIPEPKHSPSSWCVKGEIKSFGEKILLTGGSKCKNWTGSPKKINKVCLLVSRCSTIECAFVFRQLRVKQSVLHISEDICCDQSA